MCVDIIGEIIVFFSIIIIKASLIWIKYIKMDKRLVKSWGRRINDIKLWILE